MAEHHGTESPVLNNNIEHEEHGLLIYLLPILFVALFTGCLFQFILLKFPPSFRPPYTAVLFIFGFLLALSDKYIGFGLVGEGIHMLKQIDPEVILLVLLPPLLFESCSKIDWHVFQRVAGQSILLAFPGVIISAALTASFIQVAFSYDWSWPTAFALGSILSATDPVSVVAALHSLGAPHRIAILIEGESVLNDGSAFVMFLIFIQFVAGVSTTPVQVAIQACQLTLGGPVVGIFFGWLIHMCLKPIFHDPLMKTAAVFTSIFFVFYIADHVLKVSAVLAIVCFSLYFAARGKEFLDVESYAHHDTFISQVGWLANTLIFVISGAVIFELYSGGQFGGEALSGNNPFATNGYFWLDLLFLYLALTVIRGIAIACLWPFLKIMGYGFDLKVFLLLIYAGLRGAVSLTLALIVIKDTRIDLETRFLIAFHVCGIVVLTTLVNGTTTEWFYGKLKIERPCQHSAELAMNVFAHIEKDKISMIVNELRQNWFYREADWQNVSRIVPDLASVRIVKGRIKFAKSENVLGALKDVSQNHTQVQMNSRPSMYYNRKTINWEAQAVRRSQVMSSFDVLGYTKPQMEEQIRNVFFTALIADYETQYEQGYIDVHVKHVLMDAAEVGMESGPSSQRDTPKYPKNILSTQKVYHQFEQLLKSLPKLEDAGSFFGIPLTQKMTSDRLGEMLIKTISILSAFIHANNEVLSNLSDAVLWAETDYLKPLAKEVKAVNQSALKTLKEIQKRYPLQLCKVKTINASQYLIRLKKEIITDKQKKGFLDHSVYEQVNEHLDRTLKKLHEHPSLLFTSPPASPQYQNRPQAPKSTYYTTQDIDDDGKMTDFIVGYNSARQSGYH